MAFDLTDSQFQGPALPEPFVKFELERELTRLRLLPKTVGQDGKQLKEDWEVYRRKLKALAASGGSVRVFNHVIEPLLTHLGYARREEAGAVQTREDREDGGTLLLTEDGTAKLRVWFTSFNEDLFAPARRGRAYRFSHQRVAQRVLLAAGERLGLLTNGVQLLLLISDPARPDSTITIPLDPGWKSSREVPDSFRLLLAIASPGGIKALPELVDKARLQQARVTKELRVQAREAVEHFIQEILDLPANRDWFSEHPDHDGLAKQLWREGLITVYRLLFILKLETSDDLARSFSFASTSLWRNTYSPSMALAPYARDVRERGVETGQLLENGLRTLFRMFEYGLECTELVVKPLGGALFGPNATPILSQLTWGEQAVSWLLDRLLWTPRRRGAETRERVHYGPLDVEDLGRVYEALLELEPGISTVPMCRLRRQKLEVVVPGAQGERYRPAVPVEAANDDESDDEIEEPIADEEESFGRAGRTKVDWIEAIPPDRFYLRVGLGRKASGSYYTPHSFVRFLVQETLGPQVAERSPAEDPHPLNILQLKVLDPAMGSGHFLVEACRFLGEKLYEACRLCDDKALAAERKAEKLSGEEKSQELSQAQGWRQRIIDLPDPNDELLKYLPSRSPEGEESGLSQLRAIALCRRLVATHCLYGVDKNPLAVELAKLALWLESHAEGMPLTFLDHRLVLGDSLSGPFWDKLLFRPSKPTQPVEGLFSQGLSLKFTNALHDAIRYVRDLDASVGSTVAEIEHKRQTKSDLDRALLPFRIVAAAWSGGVMLGPEQCDDQAYAVLLQSIANSGEVQDEINSELLRNMIAKGLGVIEVPKSRTEIYDIFNSGRCDAALPYDLAFPEVFYPSGVPHARKGFDAVLGNPPWDAIQLKSKEFFAAFDFDILDASTPQELKAIESRLLASPHIESLFNSYASSFEDQKRTSDTLYSYQKVSVQGDLCGRQLDMFRVFMERNTQLLSRNGYCGVVVPSAFHANEGATGVRDLYLHKLSITQCYSFDNARQLFEIHRSIKFATVVAKNGLPTTEFSAAFYLKDDEWLFDYRGRDELQYSSAFIKSFDPLYYSFPELKDRIGAEILSTAFNQTQPLREHIASNKLRFKRELTDKQCAHIVVDSPPATLSWDAVAHLSDLVSAEWITVVKGEGIHQFTERFTTKPYGVIPPENVLRSLTIDRAFAFYRIAIRKIGRSTDERTFIATFLPPALLCHESIQVDVLPQNRSYCESLVWLGVFNSFCFDWIVRQIVAATLSLFIIEKLPLPRSLTKLSAVGRSVLRLLANNALFEPLWRDQLGDNWRESNRMPFTWPVLATNQERWNVRAAIDAVVAEAYGLTRDQYEHVLSTFSHSSYHKAPELCLAMFDELKQLGLEAFTKKHDPYWDIPLNENLPQPAIDLPIPVEAVGSSDSIDDDSFILTNAPKRKSGRGKGRK